MKKILSILLSVLVVGSVFVGCVKMTIKERDKRSICITKGKG